MSSHQVANSIEDHGMGKWLVKAEPAECGIEDFAANPEQAIRWDGVRNYQARNFLRRMELGDEVLIYHSSCKHIGVAGVAKVVTTAFDDPTQFDPESPYCDPKSPADNPRWQAVGLQFVSKRARILPLDEMKALPGLEKLALVKRGNRLSVMPVSEDEWRIINTH